MKNTQIVPTTTTLEAVPTPQRRHPAPHPPPTRARLRELLAPPAPTAYLTAGERCLITTRRHWLLPLRSIASGAAMMTAVGLLALLAPGLLVIQVALMASALAHTTWVGWCVLRWRVEQIAVTDTRIIRVSGLVTLRVDTAHLSQVTDISLRRSIPGRILNYGELRIETAGQKQGIEHLTYLPAPNAIYNAMLR